MRDTECPKLGMRSGSFGRAKRGWEDSDDDLLDNMFTHKKFMADVSELFRLVDVLLVLPDQDE